MMIVLATVPVPSVASTDILPPMIEPGAALIVLASLGTDAFIIGLIIFVAFALMAVGG